jgi:hypothetical protein
MRRAAGDAAIRLVTFLATALAVSGLAIRRVAGDAAMRLATAFATTLAVSGTVPVDDFSVSEIAICVLLPS